MSVQKLRMQVSTTLKKMGSWNKKLTFKAYRAALKVAERLQKIARTAAA